MDKLKLEEQIKQLDNIITLKKCKSIKCCEEISKLKKIIEDHNSIPESRRYWETTYTYANNELHTHNIYSEFYFNGEDIIKKNPGW